MGEIESRNTLHTRSAAESDCDAPTVDCQPTKHTVRKTGRVWHKLRRKTIIENDKSKIEQLINELDEKKNDTLSKTWKKVRPVPAKQRNKTWRSPPIPVKFRRREDSPHKCSAWNTRIAFYF